LFVCLFVCFWRDSPPFPPWARAASFTTFLGHTQRYTTVDKTRSGRVISPSQRPLPDNTQHSQQTSTFPVGFKPTIPAVERPQTHALDRADTGNSVNIKYTIFNTNLLHNVFINLLKTKRRLL